jgi:UDP-N-acetyl-2-amino-2-deoxyglucuronate dehydrogenase
MLRFGLIGCGHIARRHAQLLGGGAIDGAKLTAVCDIEPDRARVMAETYDVAWTTNIADLLARDDVDIVSVLTPSGLHHDHAIAAAAAGKHVVVEKPMALRLDDADAMIRACDDAGVRLFVVKQCRFHVPVEKTREAFVTGRLGKPVLASVRVWWRRDQAYYDRDGWRGTWALDGGVLMNQAIHHIDLLQWFMGPATAVRCAGRTRLLDIETEDTASGTIEFESGALGTIEATTATRPKGVEGSFSILGDGGTVVIGGMGADRLERWAFADARAGDDMAVERYVNPADYPGYGHKAYYDHVVSCIEHSTVAAVDGREGRKSLELAAALYESMETGQTVRLPSRGAHSLLGVRG